MKWTVRSGTGEAQAEGATAFEACVAALKDSPESFKTLGTIMQAVPEGYTEDDDEQCFYCLSEKVCRKAGLWKGA